MNLKIVTFNCILKNKVGRVISSTFNRDVLNYVDENSTSLKGLTLGLQDLKKGERRQISLKAEEAYGFYDPNKIILYPRNKLPAHVKMGDSISIVGKSGRVRVYTLLKFHENMVSLDGNHPLAGQDLIFEVEVLETRLATKDEIDDSVNSITNQVLH